MLMKLDPSWLMFVTVAVTMASYLLSLGLHAVMGEDGFGPMLSTFITTSAFFGTIYLANEQGIRFEDLMSAALAGISGAFTVLLVFVLIKAVFKRLG
ncbi:hypothetical protein AB2N04_06490 [Nitratireductor sp. GISD-1A_MAKvit]|uniref:hypothetical protein n=1 Tax=Nitratireductor sp. GISD-1A_MAKvit TaxID=3234198 RepID=UPI0034670BDE